MEGTGVLEIENFAKETRYRTKFVEEKRVDLGRPEKLRRSAIRKAAITSRSF